MNDAERGLLETVAALKRRVELLEKAGRVKDPYNVRRVTANTNALVTDNLIEADTTGGNITVNIYPVIDCEKPLTIKNTGTGANTLTLDGKGAEQIEGAATQTTSTPNVSFTLAPNEARTAWLLI